MTPPPAALPIEEASRRIAAAIVPIVDVETIALRDALGRILARDIVSDDDVPAHDNAAMDGYALRAGTGTTAWRVVGEARAGQPFDGDVPADGCVRIMTGAVLPAGCDAVIPQERVERHGDRIRFDGTVRGGQHRRRAGEDLRRGATALARGQRMTAAEMGVAASVGAGRLDVIRRPRIAIFSTGNELRDVDAALVAGAIRDTNRYTLLGLVERLGAHAIDLGIVRDDPDALAAALAHAGGDDVRADAIVTSGGVSVGDADHTRAVLARLGAIDFWSLAIKPGRPMAFGTLAIGGRSTPFFGLPGNPIAVLVVFHALVRDAIIALAGSTAEPLPRIAAISDSALPKAIGRTEFVRAVATRAADGWHVRATDAQGSAQLHSITGSNCLIVLAEDRGPVAIGECVEAWPFRGLV